MVVKIKGNAERLKEEQERLFKALRDGDPMFGVLHILDKLIRPGDEGVHIRLIDEYRQKLELGDCAGIRMLAHYGSERVKMRLIDEFSYALDVKAPYSNAGWRLLMMYGTDPVKARIKAEYPEKIVDSKGDE